MLLKPESLLAINASKLCLRFVSQNYFIVETILCGTILAHDQIDIYWELFIHLTNFHGTSTMFQDTHLPKKQIQELSQVLEGEAEFYNYSKLRFQGETNIIYIKTVHCRILDLRLKTTIQHGQAQAEGRRVAEGKAGLQNERDRLLNFSRCRFNKIL